MSLARYGGEPPGAVRFFSAHTVMNRTARDLQSLHAPFSSCKARPRPRSFGNPNVIRMKHSESRIKQRPTPAVRIVSRKFKDARYLMIIGSMARYLPEFDPLRSPSATCLAKDERTMTSEWPLAVEVRPCHRDRPYVGSCCLS